MALGAVGADRTRHDTLPYHSQSAGQDGLGRRRAIAPGFRLPARGRRRARHRIVRWAAGLARRRRSALTIVHRGSHPGSKRSTPRTRPSRLSSLVGVRSARIAPGRPSLPSRCPWPSNGAGKSRAPTARSARRSPTCWTRMAASPSQLRAAPMLSPISRLVISTMLESHQIVARVSVSDVPLL